VVASYLSRFGVSSFSVLHLQYLIAGIWVLGPPVIYVGISYTSNRFENRAAPAVRGKYNWRRFFLSTLFTGIPFAFFTVLLLSIPDVWQAMTWGMGIRIYVFYLVMANIGYAVWFSVRIYPLIPFSLGGGRPLTVVFFEGEKNA
jgi:hypothetical protein